MWGTISRWLRRRPRTLVDALAEALLRPDPVRVGAVNVAAALYPLEHRSMN